MKCLDECKKVRYTLQMKGLVLHFLVRIWDTLSEVIIGDKFGKMLRKEGSHKPKFAYDIVRIHSLMIYTDMIE